MLASLTTFPLLLFISFFQQGYIHVQTCYWWECKHEKFMVCTLKIPLRKIKVDKDNTDLKTTPRNIAEHCRKCRWHLHGLAGLKDIFWAKKKLVRGWRDAISINSTAFSSTVRFQHHRRLTTSNSRGSDTYF